MAIKIKLYKRVGLKFISVFTSFLIWFHVINSEPIEQGQQVKFLVYPPKNQAIVSEIPLHLYFTLRGPRAFLNATTLQNQKIIVNLESMEQSSKNNYRIQYNSSMLNLPFGVQVVGMSPPFIDISVDKKIRKLVELKVNTAGKLGKNYEFVNSRVNPDKVWVTGPKKTLKKIKFLESQIVDVTGFQESGKVELDFPDLSETISFESEEKVFFEFKIRPTKSNYRLDKLPIYFLGTQRNFTSEAKFASISVLVPNKDYILKSDQVQIVAEIPDNLHGKARIKLKAKLPKEIHLLQIHPEYIMVNL
ncbi:MAG: YbbR-like domain-containing protein [Halobacteriovoraceae bacterium]|nr:YbbR-like domain-containing protein [Halobacteriovoraceae bacterium]